MERAIARIKSYRILHQDIPLTIAKDLDKIWSICTYLTLSLPPLIVEKRKLSKLATHVFHDIILTMFKRPNSLIASFYTLDFVYIEQPGLSAIAGLQLIFCWRIAER